jgi:gliding motility-associated-like protein
MKKLFIILSIIMMATGSLQLLGQHASEGTKYRIVAVSQSGDSALSYSNDIMLYHNFSLDLPTAFTPNNDGLNDSFGALAQGVKDFKLVVYNRYGEIVFNSNSMNDKWDGTYKGSRVPAGGYMYEVIAKSYENEELQKSGKVLVII